jgi:uncharacterized glyoxalase superfamily protein PhnB
MNVQRADPVLAVRDLEVSAAWFVEVLGCQRSDPDPGNWAFCAIGATTFMLGWCPDALPAADIGDHSYIVYLTVDDADAFHARALDAGADILEAPEDKPWGKREMTLRSPDGHRMKLGHDI